MLPRKETVDFVLPHNHWLFLFELPRQSVFNPRFITYTMLTCGSSALVMVPELGTILGYCDLRVIFCEDSTAALRLSLPCELTATLHGELCSCKTIRLAWQKGHSILQSIQSSGGGKSHAMTQLGDTSRELTITLGSTCNRYTKEGESTLTRRDATEYRRGLTISNRTREASLYILFLGICWVHVQWLLGLSSLLLSYFQYTCADSDKQAALYTGMGGAGGLSGWRWLFVFDGIITLPMALWGMY